MQIKSSNTLDEETIKKEARDYFSRLGQNQEVKGSNIYQMLVTKARTDPEYIKNLIKEGKTSANFKELRRIELVQQMQKNGLDFRILNNFKQLLFTECSDEASTKMKLSEF